jgi:hypothetical protein
MHAFGKYSNFFFYIQFSMSTGVFFFSSVYITSLKTFNSENKSKPSILMEFLYVRALRDKDIYLVSYHRQMILIF